MTTSAVHSGVNNVQVFLTVDDLLINQCLMDSLDIVPVHLTTDNLDEFFVTLELHVVDGHLVHFVNDTRIMWGQHLCTIIPVCLVAIVLTSVVRGGHVHTSLCTQLTDSERNLRCRTETLKEINLNTIG